MTRQSRVPFAMFVVALIGMLWFVSQGKWNDAKDQRNKMRRFNATLRERVIVLEQQLTVDPNWSDEQVVEKQ